MDSIKILIIHNHFPGQFRALIRSLEGNPGFTIVGIRKRGKVSHAFSGNPVHEYEIDPSLEDRATPRFRLTQATAEAVGQLLSRMKAAGYVPDLCLGHIGWGETIHFKDVYPDVPLIGYCEFFHHFQGADFGFDRELSSPTLEDAFRIRLMNATEALGFLSLDVAISPTAWQRSLFPRAFQPQIRLIHEGVDLTCFEPDGEAVLTLTDGTTLRQGQKIVTFATHSLEPYRGIHTFLRAVPQILAEHPDAQIVVAGRDEVLYGAAPPQGGSWREYLCAELQGLDDPRLHWVGFLEADDYRRLLQVSGVHVYMTVPFVLSWSLMEAMASGCILVASDTAPVREVLRHGQNACLVDFFSSAELAATVGRVLENPMAYQHLAVQARCDAETHYDVLDSVKRYSQLFQEMAEIRKLRGGT